MLLVPVLFDRCLSFRCLPADTIMECGTVHRDDTYLNQKPILFCCHETFPQQSTNRESETIFLTSTRIYMQRRIKAETDKQLLNGCRKTVGKDNVCHTYHNKKTAQASLSAAIGRTMPHHAQHSLIHVLLLWTTILSIIQIVFIIFFFSAGYHGTSQNNSAVTPERQFQANNTPSANPFLLGLGKMLTYEAKEGKDITWSAKSPEKSPVSDEGKVLNIMKDGYYFVILQVTLTSCNISNQTVSLKRGNNILLKGPIIRSTCSTGVLGKVELLSAGGTLEVFIEPASDDVNTAAFATYLDIIYIHKP